MRWQNAFPEAEQEKAAPELSLQEAWAEFPILRLRFVILSHGMELPPFHAALWHGVIGARLRELDPHAYLQLWEQEAGSLYAIHAPYGPTRIAPGEHIAFELRLFGNGVALANSIAAAVLGATASLGSFLPHGQRGSGELEQLFSIGMGGPIPLPLRVDLDLADRAIAAGKILENVGGRQSPAVRLLLDAPLRLKDQGHLLTRHPSFSQLLRRIFGRMRQLNPVSEAQTARDLIARATAIDAHGAVRWVDLERWSARQRAEMAFGGIHGFLEYHGELGPYLPWLALGEWLQLGGKTTFGLGAYQLQIAE